MLNKEQMKKAIAEKNYYVVRYWITERDCYYELARDGKNGYIGGVELTEKRALEWIAIGAEVCEM